MSTISTICISGAGHGGLLFARLMKMTRPATRVVVLEREGRGTCAARRCVVGPAAQALIGEYDPVISHDLQLPYGKPPRETAASASLTALLIAGCERVGVELVFSSAAGAIHLAEQCDLLVVDGGSSPGAAGAHARHVVHLSDGAGGGTPGLAAIEDAVALFDALWNDSRDLGAALAAFGLPVRRRGQSGPTRLIPSSMSNESSYDFHTSRQ